MPPWRVWGSFVSIEAFISRSFFLWRSCWALTKRAWQALLPMGMAFLARSMALVLASHKLHN